MPGTEQKAHQRPEQLYFDDITSTRHIEPFSFIRTATRPGLLLVLLRRPIDCHLISSQAVCTTQHDPRAVARQARRHLPVASRRGPSQTQFERCSTVAFLPTPPCGLMQDWGWRAPWTASRDRDRAHSGGHPLVWVFEAVRDFAFASLGPACGRGHDSHGDPRGSSAVCAVSGHVMGRATANGGVAMMLLLRWSRANRRLLTIAIGRAPSQDHGWPSDHIFPPCASSGGPRGADEAASTPRSRTQDRAIGNPIAARSSPPRRKFPGWRVACGTVAQSRRACRGMRRRMRLYPAKSDHADNQCVFRRQKALLGA